MARDAKSPNMGHVKVRVIEFEMEGSNETLRDSIRDIVGAIGRSPAVVVSRGNATAALNGPVRPGAEQPSLEPAELSPDDVIDAEQPPEKSQSRGAKSRQPPRSPVILNDLDFSSGENPLKPFLQRHNVNSDAQRYLLIAFWLKDNRKLAEVTMDHIHTAYRLMGWSTPADASLPLRSLKQQGLFKKGDSKGGYALNHIGENRATELMAKNPASA